MDSVFFLGQEDRANFIQEMMHSFGCTYICLWSYFPPPSNCLRYTDGFYHERSNLQQPSSSSGTLSQRLFDQYRQSIAIVHSNFVPGLAFLSKNPYMELESTDLLGMASTEIQRQFYQEARIKNALFLGCSTGEIELGFSDDYSSQVNLEMEMRAWFSEDINRQKLSPIIRDIPQPNTTTTDQNQNRPASSSSSLRSLSYDSPAEYSPIVLFDYQQQQQQAMIQPSPRQQAIRTLTQIRNVQLPDIESEDAAITRAMLAVISNTNIIPSSSSSPTTATSTPDFQFQPQHNLPPNYQPVRVSQASAFRQYRPSLAPSSSRTRTRRQNMLKRAFSFLSTLHPVRIQQGLMPGGRPSTTQLHHMIAERRRREKLNESFQTLRSLLPPGTKKDKASVLASTTEQLKSLINQVAELSKMNRILEAQLLPQKSAAQETTSTAGGGGGGSTTTADQRVEVQLTNVAASTSTSNARYADLRVTVRGDVSMTDLAIRLLEFLKPDHNVNLMSVEADSRINADTSLVSNVIMRLRIEDGGEWDESAFRETIRRVVADLVEKP